MKQLQPGAVQQLSPPRTSTAAYPLMTHRELTSLKSLEEIVLGDDFVVPPYPAVALRLRRLLESEKYGLAEVANTASADPALAATLLKLANSAAYGQTAAPPITTLARAVHRLGARSVARLATAIQVGAGACGEGPLVDLKYRLWRRSVSVALACQKLAAPRALDTDAAFLAGLLSGFGCSVALGCVERVLARMSRVEARTPAEWLAAIEPHRSVLARRVAEHWQLPREIADAVAPQGGSRNPVAALIGAAERLIDEIERGASGEEIASLAELSSKERRAALELREELAPALEALVQPPAVIKGRPAASAVRKPASSLGPSVRAVQLSLSDLKNRRSPVPLRGVGVAPDGVVFNSERPMQEGCVARLGLNAAPALVEGWFSVASCQTDKTGYRIEAQAFAATAELREVLMTLWTGATIRP